MTISRVVISPANPALASALTSMLADAGIAVTGQFGLGDGIERRDAVGAAGLAVASVTLLLQAADSDTVRSVIGRFRARFGDRTEITVKDDDDPDLHIR